MNESPASVKADDAEPPLMGNEILGNVASYYGKICAKHPQLDGLRRNGNCPACERERKRSPEYRAQRSATRDKARTRQRVKKWRVANPDKWRSIASARNAARRARSDNSPEIRRAWARLRLIAAGKGLVVDHIVPLAPCRICGAQGKHTPDNWQLLSPRDNERKGNRCMKCWLPRTRQVIEKTGGRYWD